MSYCTSRFHSLRRTTSEVMVGGIGIGGKNPVRIQSMTTSDTQDVDATVKQTIALAEVGCEIVRITAPNVQAARCLKDIRAKLDAAGFKNLPLVADIHFLPQAAMEAVEHVEKVRVNPGNYADKKKFAVRDYTDADYDAELQRIYETFTPLVKRAKELGRALRIGTNHGSLSDRIMNRYGDTPLGMVESALEFLRIAESHGYRQLVLSMKSSNPKVMIQAYRLLVQRMQQEQMHYPLHLGVTEAGDGEDGRIKGAIGIGSLLLDGLGDTIRVSLTEDSVYEVPVAAALANKAAALWHRSPVATPALEADAIDPYHFTKRPTATIAINSAIVVGPEQPPRVIARVPSLTTLADLVGSLSEPRLQDTPPEGLLVATATGTDLAKLGDILATLPWPKGTFAAAELGHALTVEEVVAGLVHHRQPAVVLRRFAAGDEALLDAFLTKVRPLGHTLAIATDATSLASLGDTLRTHGDDRIILTLAPSTTSDQPSHAPGAYRQLAEAQRRLGLRAPLWIRNTTDTEIKGDTSFLSRLLESSILTGSLLCDGLGDLVSIETEADPIRAIKLAYNVLQGASARITKTEFVACPSCGRTLFDLQTTTQRIRAKTGHLKGVKIAIMGCIVNGPGEMADADFGYVGGAPGKINLYVGKNCVQYNIPQAQADDRLIALIAEHGKWVEPPFPSV